MSRAIVVGSINRDIVATVPKHARPGETVLGTHAAMFPGGKEANQAVAIARAGGRVAMVGRVGDDAFGSEMRAFLAAEGVETSGIETVAETATGIALITVDANAENCITVVPGANLVWPATPPHVAVAAGDVVVCQFEIPIPVVAAVFARAHAAGARTLLNPAPFQPIPDAVLAATDSLVLNEIELAQLAGLPQPIPAADTERIAAVADAVIARGPRLVVVTLGAAGVVLRERGQISHRVDSYRVDARDTTGAGDCFIGTFVAHMQQGKSAVEAASFANAAAALSVTRNGAAASFPTLNEIASFLARA